MKKMKNCICCFHGEHQEEQEEEQPPAAPTIPPPTPQASWDQSESLNPVEPTDSSETIGNYTDYNLNSLLDASLEEPLTLQQLPNPEVTLNPVAPIDSSETIGSVYYVSSPDASLEEPLTLHQLPNPEFTALWHEILDGTLNFQSTNLLGRGNFGEVYRCDFPRIDRVGATKIQHVNYPYGRIEYEAEIATLERANHANVIQLLGKCADEYRVIVYEFMPRGSLDQHLFAPARPIPALLQDSPGLSWERRMSIAVGVAEALVYVHDELELVHRDVKIGNVLLDEGFVPKLTDFGLAIPILEDIYGREIQSDIYPIKGTPGCMAPETVQSGLVSTKSDVYSYGVFLYQLFTGKNAYDLRRRLDKRELTDWLTMPIWTREENFPMMVDPLLGNRFSVEGLNRLFQTARMCIAEQANDRPDMGFVEAMVRQCAAYVVPASPGLSRSRSF